MPAYSAGGFQPSLSWPWHLPSGQDGSWISVQTHRLVDRSARFHPAEMEEVFWNVWKTPHPSSICHTRIPEDLRFKPEQFDPDLYRCSLLQRWTSSIDFRLLSRWCSNTFSIRSEPPFSDDPYAALLSTLLTLGTLSRYSEITAFKAGGLASIGLPFLSSSSSLSSVLVLLGNDYLVPLPPKNSISPWCEGAKEPRQAFSRLQDLVPQRSPHFQHPVARPKEKALKGFTLYEFDDQFRCIQRIDAIEARWINEKWRFSKEQ